MALGNLAQRALVALVAVPILLVVLYLGRPEPTFVLIFAAAVIAMDEFFAMTITDTSHRRASVALGALACAALYWLHPMALHGTSRAALVAGAIGPAIAPVLAVVPPMLYYLFRFKDMNQAAGRIAATVSGIVYAGFLCMFLAITRREFGGDAVIAILVVAWIGDTGAYFAGRFLGKTKLYPEVSPKKTRAGAVGGLAGSVAALAVMKLVRMHALSWVDVFAIGLPGAVLGQMGDLVESLIKRSVGVKDSGALLPGHGGMLDRIDAVLFIGPFVYAYLLASGYPVVH
jgi:phosphatidate cytidylyltransferase